MGVLLFHVPLQQSMKFRITEEGLSSQEFFLWFKWRTIPWDEIYEISMVTRFGSIHPYWIIRAKRLSLLQQLAGMSNIALGTSSGIMVSSTLKEIDEFVKEIESRITQKP